MKLFLSICLLASALSTTALADGSLVIIDTRIQGEVQNSTEQSDVVGVPVVKLAPQTVVCDDQNVCYVKMTKEQSAKYKKGQTDASVVIGKFHDH